MSPVSSSFAFSTHRSYNGDLEVEQASRGDESLIVTSDGYGFPLGTQEIRRRKVEGVERPHRDRKRLERPSQDGWHHFKKVDPLQKKLYQLGM